MPVTLKRVPIVSVGEWPVGRSDGGTGTQVTRDKLDRAVLNAASGRYPRPVIGLGHGADRKANGQNGTPALGGLTNLTVEPNESGVDTLYADLTNVPEWAPDRYPRRSAEWWETTDGEMVIHRLALLGDEYPAVDTLDDLEALVTDEGPALLAAGAVLASGAAHNLPPLGADQPAEGSDHIEQEEPTMTVDTTALRQSLPDLPADADDATVIAEASKRLVASAEADTAAEAQETVEVDAVTEEVEVTASADADADEDEATKTVTVPAAEYTQMRADAKAGREAREAQLEAERVAIAAAAVKEGRILASSQDAWAKRLAVDPDARVLLTASAEEGGFPIGSVAPVGAMKGHAVTASANAPGGLTDDQFYELTYGKEG